MALPTQNVGVIIKEAARFFEESQNGYDSLAGMHLYEVRIVFVPAQPTADSHSRKILSPLSGD